MRHRQTDGPPPTDLSNSLRCQRDSTRTLIGVIGRWKIKEGGKHLHRGVEAMYEDAVDRHLDQCCMDNIAFNVNGILSTRVLRVALPERPSAKTDAKTPLAGLILN